MHFRLGLALAGFLLLAFSTLAQTDTAFYAVRGNRVHTKAASRTYVVDVRDPADTLYGISYTYLTRTDKLLREAYFKAVGAPVHHGLERTWDSTGYLVSERYYIDGFPDSTFRVFYPNGMLKRLERYRDRVRIEGHCFDTQNKEVPFYEYYVSPQPHKRTSMMRFLSNRVNYTRKMRQEGAEGVMLVSFIVNKAGTISYVRIEKGLHPDLDKQVEAAFNELPEGRPGLLDGKPYPVKVMVPLYFSKTGSTLNSGVFGKSAQVAMNTVTVMFGFIPGIPIAIGRSVFRRRSVTYQLDKASRYFEQPIYGPRP